MVIPGAALYAPGRCARPTLRRGEMLLFPHPAPPAPDKLQDTTSEGEREATPAVRLAESQMEDCAMARRMRWEACERRRRYLRDEHSIKDAAAATYALINAASQNEQKPASQKQRRLLLALSYKLRVGGFRRLSQMLRTEGGRPDLLNFEVHRLVSLCKAALLLSERSVAPAPLAASRQQSDVGDGLPLAEPHRQSG